MIPKKYRVHAFLAFIALVIIFYPSYSRKPDQQRVEASTIAATHFFDLVDSGQYEQSWHAAAAYLKEDIPLEDWVKRLSAVRTAAGKLIDRKQKNYIYTKEDKQNIPDGEYMVYIFTSKFENKDDLSETLTLMLEEGKIWRVAGYFID
ncbi:MAG: DUF4019 domain-containing protein [Deltaproteobacteria bacterium]|nr:DUF4019 domain-containing protein [Deltaproteobacteria bacterium]MCW8893116.1 DUF4019 domain-containing protein [Deltaproteobacteria bacterium]MCW9050065.1 DUF4019 domain-containing protein [Deltaproteobacteria bacterium]